MKFHSQSLVFPRLSLPLLIVMFLHFNLAAQSGIEFQCATPDESFACNGPEADLADYVPSSSDKIKTIRIAFHIMQQSSGNPQNFSENNPAHVDHLMQIFNRLNTLYSNANVPACGGDFLPQALNPRDSRIQFELVGIYYHKDSQGFINEDGTYYNTYCETTYGTCNVIDVYFCQFQSTVSGYGPGKWVLLVNLFSEYVSTFGDSWWAAGNLLGHELGHCFNLYHSWECHQKCRFPDICQGGPTSGCPDLYSSVPCIGTAYDDGCYGSHTGYCKSDDDNGEAGDWRCSNNMMSYAIYTDHISPLQMAAMHKHITGSNSDALAHQYNNTEDVTINNANVVWSTNRVVYGDIYIEPGAKLTIRGKVLMPTGSRIIVKRGARLIVEGGHLTTKGPALVNCNGTQVFDRWTGIEVWGNTSISASAAMFEDSYIPQTNDPGAVILRSYNGRKAKIENALIGIQTQQNGAYSWENSKVFHFNGLIKASDAQFINCRKSIAFLSHLAPINNPSIFERCEFYQNFLPGDAKANEGVTQWQVKGIVFIDCKFEKLQLGVSTLNSTFFVGGSTFQTCTRGVTVGATSNLFNMLSVVGGATSNEQNIFENCSYGVINNGYNLLQVSNNLFRHCTFGVMSEGTSGFQITDNTFDFNSIGQLNFNSAISITSTGGGFNFAECNQYDGAGALKLYSGITALGLNNNFTFRKEDFDCFRDVQVVKAILANGTSVPGKISNQGTFINAVRNLFTGVILAGDNYKWQNGHAQDIFTPNPAPSTGNPDSEEFIYFYPPNTPVESRLIPKCPKQGFGIMPTVCGIQFNFINTLPTADGSTTCGTRIIKDFFNEVPNCRTEQCLNNYYATIHIADSLIRKGNANQLLSAIQNSPNSTSTLQSLTAASPYLSNRILNTILESATMTENNKFDVLSANTPLPAEVLENASGYLSSVILTQLQAASPEGQLSTRDSVKSTGIDAQRYKSALLAHLTDSLFAAGNFSHVETLLQNDPDRESREAIVSLKIQLQDYTSAQTLLNSYPTNDVADTEFRDLQSINLRRITESANFQLTAAEDSFLHAQAHAYGPQTGYARSLLYLLKGELIDREIPVYDAPEERNQPLAPEHIKPIENTTTSLILRPNPATDHVSLIIPGWHESSVFEIRVMDLAGRQSLVINPTSPMTSINIANLTQGMYLVSLTRNGTQVDLQKLVIH